MCDDVREGKSKIWGISHFKGDHFPVVVAKKPLTLPASLAARPHLCNLSSTCQMVLDKVTFRSEP